MKKFKKEIINDDEFELICKFIKLRHASNITQKELSEATGLSIQCISDIENENSGNPTLKSLIKYLDCLGYEITFQKKSL